jgi:hypothetical protein
VPTSIAPRIWQVLRFRLKGVADQMCNNSLINASKIAELMTCVDERTEMNQKTIRSAAALLDPRFQGHDLGINDESTSVAAAENLIITLAQNQQTEQVYILDDLAKYKQGRDNIVRQLVLTYGVMLHLIKWILACGGRLM